MKKIILPLALTLLASCQMYTLVEEGETKIADNMTVTTPVQWSKLNVASTGLHRSSQVWTINGQQLEELIFVPNIQEGSTVFKTLDKGNPMPEFKNDLLMPELAELIGISLNKSVGETETEVEVSNLAPRMAGNDRGITFNLRYKGANGVSYLGKALAIKKNEKLHVIMYVAAKVHFYDASEKHIEKIFDSVVLSRLQSISMT